MRTYLLAFAMALMISTVARAGGHTVTSGHSSGGGLSSSLHSSVSSGGFVAHSLATNSSGFSSSGFSTGGFSTSGFGRGGFSTGGFGESEVFSPGLSELSSFRPEFWDTSLEGALRSLRVETPPPALPQRCCLECAERSNAPAETSAPAPRHAAKPVIIEVAPSDVLPRVWVVPGPVDIGHRAVAH